MSEMDVGTDISSVNISYVTEDGIPEELIEDVAGNTEIASAINSWMNRVGGARSRTNDIFQRTRWTSTDHLFALMSMCAKAVEEDDVLSTLADSLESLFFQRMRFEMHDQDQEDVWNQIAADIDLDARFRQIFRELFKVSQCYVGVWWQRKVYTVRTPYLKEGDVDPETGMPTEKGKGNRERKKRFDIIAPTALNIFDPVKVVPVGNVMFGNERFAYIATEEEHKAFHEVQEGNSLDRTVLQLIEGPYQPDAREAKLIQSMDADPKRMWLFRKDAIFRITRTKADYERFATPRLRTILELLDLKSHIRASDRATLIGSTNFIVIIKKGSDKLPARQAEIENLQEQARVVARMPILVGDHRLSVEIVTPKMDFTLNESRYWAIDSRIVFRAVQTLTPSQQTWAQHSAGSQSSETSRAIAIGLESQRSAVVRQLERTLFRNTMDKNPELFDEKPHVAFSPKRVSINLDVQFLNRILELRDRGDVSRESILEEFEYDQDIEAQRRLYERKVYDPVFHTAVPHSSPDANPFADGRKGGGKQGPPGSDEDEEEDDD